MPHVPILTDVEQFVGSKAGVANVANPQCRCLLKSRLEIPEGAVPLQPRDDSFCFEEMKSVDFNGAEG